MQASQVFLKLKWRELWGKRDQQNIGSRRIKRARFDHRSVEISDKELDLVV
jgi:hypothetical protein